MTYIKYRWDEDRGDEYAWWGRSWWYFEVDPDGYPSRQVEVYDCGVKLRYGADHIEDQFGGLSYANVREWDRPPGEMLTADEFEAVWRSVQSGVTG